jgi:hypothetical protein
MSLSQCTLTTLPDERSRNRSSMQTAVSRCDPARLSAADYMRYGTINLFAALDAKAGIVIGEFHRRHRAIEFRNFLETIDASVPGQLDLHLILDNYGTH